MAKSQKVKVYYAPPVKNIKLKDKNKLHEYENCIHVAKVVIKKIHKNGMIETPSCMLPKGFCVNQQDAIDLFRKNIAIKREQLLKGIQQLDSIDLTRRCKRMR